MDAKAMVLEKFNEPLILKTFPVPNLKEGEVLVKIEAAGVCGSDVHQWEGRDPRIRLPMILGHEGAGEVVELRGDKKDVYGIPLRVGDKVLWSRGVTCGHCYFCKVKMEPSLCSNRWVYGIHTTCLEPPYLTGNYAEYLPLDPRVDFFKIESEVNLQVLVPATCSGATTAHAFDLSGMESGDSVLVQGAGPIGIFAVAFARSFGASQIIAIGGTEDRLKMCKTLGATLTLNRNKLSKEVRKEAVMEVTHGLGVDVAFEMAGESDALTECISLTRTGGACVSAGFAEPRGKMEIDPFLDIGRKNLRLQGIWVSEVRHTHMALQLILSRMEEFEKLITHRFSLSEANDAIRVMKTKEAVKAVLLPHA
ncbi:MAG: alcohol dehydrogenase [Deltaproteobacteria bacterium RBG_16_48_10]|nr:MAG: alcohol dehydrogenase [Deltaproteobacteria bacterium RBG_16_48_10]